MKVLITDCGFPDVERERSAIEASGATLEVAQCRSEDEVIAVAADADVLLVQWAPISERVISALNSCRAIVRYGIGVDNVNLVAARAHNIAVCNVPDYGVDEVADHAFALGLALSRQLPFWHSAVQRGEWPQTPPRLLQAFNEMTFATAGLGRIARAVLSRARGAGFQVAAYDPFVSAAEFERLQVTPLDADELFAQADILSLHLPLTPATASFVNAERLQQMKKSAVLVNTARGPLVDNAALASALQSGDIGAAGLDVFETEPLPASHPLRMCENALLTPHIAWYSSGSIARLQQLAAEEVVRALRGEALRCPVSAQ
jgi:D-3-phosphoglycerate dehydrogenase